MVLVMEEHLQIGQAWDVESGDDIQLGEVQALDLGKAWCSSRPSWLRRSGTAATPGSLTDSRLTGERPPSPSALPPAERQPLFGGHVLDRPQLQVQGVLGFWHGHHLQVIAMAMVALVLT